MRETIGSLKAYFVVIGIIGLIVNIVTILPESRVNPLFLIIGLIGAIFAVAYLCIGMMLRMLLIKLPKLVISVIIASTICHTIVFCLTLASGIQTIRVIQLAIGILINWYLLSNVKRLSQQEKSKTTPE